MPLCCSSRYSSNRETAQACPCVGNPWMKPVWVGLHYSAACHLCSLPPSRRSNLSYCWGEATDRKSEPEICSPSRTHCRSPLEADLQQGQNWGETRTKFGPSKVTGKDTSPVCANGIAEHQKVSRLSVLCSNIVTQECYREQTKIPSHGWPCLFLFEISPCGLGDNGLNSPLTRMSSSSFSYQVTCHDNGCLISILISMARNVRTETLY